MASAAAEEKSEEAAAASSESGGGSNKLVMILTIVNTVVTAAIIAILLVTFKQAKSTPSITDMKIHEGANGHAEGKGEEGKEGGEHAKSESKKPAEFGKMVTLEQFAVNLSTPGSSESKFVRVNVSLEVPNEEAESEITAKMPQIRNVIIDLFNSKRPNDLATAEGRDYLKEEIRNALNGFLIRGKVKGVFFTNFVFSG